MGQKKNIIKSPNNLLDNFKLFNKFNNKWDIMFDFCINYFVKNNYSKTIINGVKMIHYNKSFCLIFFLFAGWFWSTTVLNFVYCFMLIDSLIISLLVLQNNSVETNSRRLSKNVILMYIAYINPIGGVLTLLMISFIYMEYSKFVGRLIFKLIKFLIKIIGNIFPPIYLFYPDIKLFNFVDPDMTIHENQNKKNIKILKPSSTSSTSYLSSTVSKVKKTTNTNKNTKKTTNTKKILKKY